MAGRNSCLYERRIRFVGICIAQAEVEAAIYTELLHPGQSNSQFLSQFKAESVLEDGRYFMVNVSYDAPDVADHTTIKIQ